ncbi:Hypothetical predicted protein [Olea europaea subsp. europaea]|uniref:Pentatricopeptide repeat-containing protein n=1 Tax=Olea europaea subsp. europaea TaxID=158383 RepID=A0A8S0SPP5_OLEEU|nr:Hypothetical predicted protein [Olea europaea subsp. europaea]
MNPTQKIKMRKKNLLKKNQNEKKRMMEDPLKKEKLKEKSQKPKTHNLNNYQETKRKMGRILNPNQTPLLLNSNCSLSLSGQPPLPNVLDKGIAIMNIKDLIKDNTLINGLCRVGNVDRAQKLLREVQSQAGGLEKGLKLWDEMNERKVSPNLFTFSVLINALCKENRLNEACDLLRQMQWREDIIPQPFIYNPVIDGFSKAGNVDEANAIVAEMEVKGCSLDKLTFTILFWGIV